MRILSIGNSFSEDAQRYLHRAAGASGVNIESVNLYIGGCPLERHYNNMLSGEAAYELQINGQATGAHTSIKEALTSGEWDVVTLQQVSQLAPNFATYEPYITELSAYVRAHAPNAKLLIQQTWAYEDGSFRLTEELGYKRSADMLSDVVKAYNKAAALISADGIIPSGEMLMRLHECGISKVHRDTFHASFGVGRYALSLLWIRMLTSISVTGNSFSDFDAAVTDEEKKIAWAVVDSFEPLSL